MSSPTTPSRQHCGSRASTPSTASHGSPSGQLTPRSKVRAMLAALDDDSDVEIEAVGGIETGINNNTEGRGLGVILGNGNSNPENIGGSSQSEDDADDEEVLPLAPKGRMAARMLAKKNQALKVPEQEDNAYERVKKELIAGRQALAKGTAESTRSTTGGSQDDERICDAAPRQQEKPTTALASRQASPNTGASQSRRSSPGLFVSPGPGSAGDKTQAVAAGSQTSDSDLPSRPSENSRFLALVARKREERIAKEEAEARRKAEKEAQLKTLSKHTHNPRGSSQISGSENDSADNADGKRLTQQARPTRKASKKALEEMNRETQRMSRNMQLAHQARTKKKITKESFFAKFNFQPTGSLAADNSKAANSSTTASSAAVSDVEGLQRQETPPTSPVAHDGLVQRMDEGDKAPSLTSIESIDETSMALDEELPTMEEVMTQPVQRVDKGKGRATERSLTPMKGKKTTFTQRPIKIHPPKQLKDIGSAMADSDSDLEIVAEPTLKLKKADIFDRVPAEKTTDARSLLTLRALANLTSPGKQSGKTKASMTPAEMQSGLRKRARQQAAQERAEKLQQLRNRGIIVQTAEERQKDQAEVEDLVEKARREAEEIMKKEKDVAKKEGKEIGKTDGLDDTSDEDEEYVEDVEEENVELSGSEEEESSHNREDSEGEEDEDVPDDEENDLSMNKDTETMSGLIDQEASEDDEEEEHGDDEVSEGDEERAPTTQHRRKSKNVRVISDDDDDEEISIVQPPKSAGSARKPFIPGLPMSAGAPLGLTQAFAATMADSQTQADGAEMADSLDPEQDSLAFLRSMPEPNFPMFEAIQPQESEDIIRDSQASQDESRIQESQEASKPSEIDLHYSQSQIRYDSLHDTQHLLTATQYSEIPDPSQDVGFALSSPHGGRFAEAPPSTVDTVLLSGVEKRTSPAVKKKGRLRRRIEAIPILSDVEQDSVHSDTEGNFQISANYFDVMRKSARKPAQGTNDFDKKKSEAKGMVEEQAEESEDEYAGLGGASDDESGGSEDEEVRKMIDESDIKVDERKLAAFYADKERASDAKAVEKLFKDMNSGMLRRKRGADFDLSDSDSDGGEARRKRKQREFARMRKALLEDENVGKIAENPKKLAFLRAIEDRDKDDDDDIDIDFLDQPDDDASQTAARQEDSQTGGGGDDSQSQFQTAPALQTTTNKRKRPLEPSIPDAANHHRPAPHLRRTTKQSKTSQKPSTLAEIRESLSFLLEEPAAEPPPLESSSDIEDTDAVTDHAAIDSLQARQTHTPDVGDPDPPPPRTENNRRRRRTTNPIIDRLTLKRAESAGTATTASSGSRATSTKLAFHDPTTAAVMPVAFPRVPSLLRRATTQVTSVDSNHGVTTAVAGTERMAGGDGRNGNGRDGVVKRGGSKKSSINYFAREQERRKGVEERERRREEGRVRVAGGERGRRGIVGVLGGGSFD